MCNQIRIPNKDVKKYANKLLNLAYPKDSFEVKSGNHLKVKWSMNDLDGKQVVVKCLLPKTPSCRMWTKAHQTQLKKQFIDKNICTDVLKRTFKKTH